MLSTPSDTQRRTGRSWVPVLALVLIAIGPTSESSAECVMEAPSGSSGVLPLDNFTSVSFTAASAIQNGKRFTSPKPEGSQLRC